MSVRLLPLACLLLCGLPPLASAGDAPPGKVARLPHLEFDLQKKQARVECEALNAEGPLEFFCCETGTNEYESVLRSSVKPSDLHTVLLAMGLKPGEPVTYSDAAKKWIPPHGPPLHITLEYEKDGRTVSVPGFRWMRDIKTKQEPKAFTWVFAGSRVMPDGKYAADITGYIVSIVNFDLTMIDIPELASSANETLEWEHNPAQVPKTGTKVWMVIEPAGGNNPPVPAGVPAPPAPATQPAPEAHALADFPASQPSGLSDVHSDEARMKALHDYWQSKVAPHASGLREAAQAHYEVIAALRHEQQRLIDEADRIQRSIDQLEKEYQDMTTPQPRAGS